MHNRLLQSLNGQLQAAKVRLAGNARALQTISPLNTLARGYAIVQSPAGAVITSTSQIEKNQQIEIQVAQGEFGATINQIGKKP